MYINKHKLYFTFFLGVNIIQTEKGNCSKDSKMVEYSENCAKYIDCQEQEHQTSRSVPFLYCLTRNRRYVYISAWCIVEPDMNPKMHVSHEIA